MSLAASQSLDPAELAPSAPAPARVASKLTPLNALLIVSLAIPEEYSFYAGSMRLTIARVLLLLSAPVLVVSFFKQGARLRLTDALVAGAGLWMILSVSMVTDIGSALAHAGPEVLEFAVAYFVFRLWTKTPGQVWASLDLFCLVISIAALLSVPDFLSDRFVLHDLSASLTGYVKTRQHDHRLGMLRAEGPFEHPIHLGILCSASFVIALAAPIRRRVFCLVASGVGLLAALSSAPLQACVLGCGLVAYGRIFSRHQRRWVVLTTAATVLIGGAFLLSHSPLGFVADHLTFDPESAWSREYQWQMDGAVVAQNPWFGIAFFNWPAISREVGTFETVDALWLVLALSYGLPGAILVGASMLSAARARIRGPSDDKRKAACELLSILLVQTIYIGFSVDYWAALWVFIGIITGLRASRGCVGEKQRRA